MVWKLSYVSREKALIVNENVKCVFSSEETQCHSFSAGTGHVKWYQTIGRLWWNVFVCPLCVISRTACLAVVSVGLDPARLVIPTEANLWPEGPEPFHTGSTRRRRCYGERKMYACIQTWEQLKVALCCPLKTLCLLKSSILSLSFFLQKSCREGCGLSQSVTVPQTTVDFDVWEKKNVSNHWWLLDVKQQI